MTRRRLVPNDGSRTRFGRRTRAGGACRGECRSKPRQLGMKGRVDWTGDRDNAAAQIAAWKAAGATHLSVNTMAAGLANVDDHLAALQRVAADLK